MPTRPDESAALAAKQAKSPEVAGLFEQLAKRAVTYAQMQDEFLESLIRHREERTGKPFRHTKSQRQFLDECDRDAERASQDVARFTAKMDDRSLLISELSSEDMQLQSDERMISSYRPEDREMVQRMMEFRRETIRIIEQFVESSPFEGQVVSIWQNKKKAAG